jgi:hypothetical protein
MDPQSLSNLRRKWEDANGNRDVQVPFSMLTESIFIYLTESSMETHGYGQISSVIIFSEESGLSKISILKMFYLSGLNIPDTEGLGTDKVFFGARDEESI